MGAGFEWSTTTDEELSAAQDEGWNVLATTDSESAQVHEHAVRLFSEPGLEEQLKYEYAHKKIIDQFGRYPHRNDCLNRESTIEELSFLKQPGSSF